MGVLTTGARLQEFPSIRFRASKPVGEDPGSGLETQALVSQRIALELDERLRQFQQAGQLPATQTCDLIIVDRCAALRRLASPRHACASARKAVSAEGPSTGRQKLYLACAVRPSLGLVSAQLCQKANSGACLVQGL